MNELRKNKNDKDKIEYEWIKIGIILLIIGIFLGIAHNIYILPQNAIITNAKIIQVSDIQHKNRSVPRTSHTIKYYKDIIFTFYDEFGKIYEKDRREFSFDQNYLDTHYLKNDEITITYDKSNPNKVIVGNHSFFDVSGMYVLIGGVIVILLAELRLHIL